MSNRTNASRADARLYAPSINREDEFDPAQATTDDHGQAQTTWTVGKTGDQTAVATLADGTTQAQITATAKD